MRACVERHEGGGDKSEERFPSANTTARLTARLSLTSPRHSGPLFSPLSNLSLITLSSLSFSWQLSLHPLHVEAPSALPLSSIHSSACFFLVSSSPSWRAVSFSLHISPLFVWSLNASLLQPSFILCYFVLCTTTRCTPVIPMLLLAADCVC